MARIQLTSDDLETGALLEPGWYPFEFVKYEEKPAKTDRSTNYMMGAKCLSEKGKNARTRILLNEKAMGFGKNLFIALGAKIEEDPITKKKSMTPIELSTEAIVGKKIDIYIARGTSTNGNDFNDAKDYAPLGKMSGYKG